MNGIEELYIKSARKLRTSLPKFVIFIGMAYIIWLVGTSFFIPVSLGGFIGAIEAARLDSIVILAAVITLLIVSFIEVRSVADATAGLVVSFVLPRDVAVEEIRLKQFRRTFRNIGYIVPFTVTFAIFTELLKQINPLIVTIVPVLITVWVVISALLLAMVMGLEIEESAKNFAEKIEKKLKRKKE